MPRVLQVGVVVLVLGMVAGCTKPAATDAGGIEGTNAAAKQNWESPRSAQALDQLRNRLAHTQTDN